MPEAAVYKYNFMKSRIDQVWFARKVPTMQTVSIRQAKRNFPDRNLRYCVFPFDTRHDRASCGLAKNICHIQSRKKVLRIDQKLFHVKLEYATVLAASISVTEVFGNIDH